MLALKSRMFFGSRFFILVFLLPFSQSETNSASVTLNYGFIKVTNSHDFSGSLGESTSRLVQLAEERHHRQTSEKKPITGTQMLGTHSKGKNVDLPQFSFHSIFASGERLLQTSGMAEKCTAQSEASTQCCLSSSSSCCQCMDNAYREIYAVSSSMPCTSFETLICSAIVDCDCAACQTEVEAVYNCANQDKCEPLQCPFNSNETGGSTVIVAVCGTLGAALLIGLIIFIARVRKRRSSTSTNVAKQDHHTEMPLRNTNGANQYTCEASGQHGHSSYRPYEDFRELGNLGLFHSNLGASQKVLSYNDSNPCQLEDVPEFVSGRREQNNISNNRTPTTVFNAESHETVAKGPIRIEDVIPIALEVFPEPHRNRLDP